jgi:PAS domain S-box-containing protein
MHQDDSSSSVATEFPGQTGPGKLERFLLVSPAFFVFLAGIVFLSRSRNLYSISDASLMFLIGIGWVIGCRKIAQLEDQATEAGREHRRLQNLHSQAEATSREIEGQLGGILKNSPFMIGSVELDNDVVTHVYESAAAEQFFARVLPAAGNQRFNLSLSRTTTIHDWLKRYQGSCWIRNPVSFEEEYATEEGTRSLTVTVAHTGRGSAGQLRYSYIAEDITDKKKSQKSLAQNQQQLTEILDTNPDAVFVLDCDWRVTYLNSQAIQTLGYGRETLGRVFWDLHPELIGSAVWNRYSEAMVERIPAEFDVFHGTGEVRFHVRALPCRNGLAVFLRDVTSERQAVDILADNEKEMRRRLAELEVLYQTAPMCLAVFDTHLRFVRINQTLAQLTGVRIEAALGRTLGEILPSSYDLIAPLLTRVFQTGEPVHSQFANTRRGEGETWRHCLANAYPLKDEARTIVGVSLALLDTTAERQAEEALRASEQRFRQLAEALPEIVWTADAAGNIDYCNSRWYAYTKCAGKDAVSEWNNFIHPADLSKWRECWARSISAGEDCEIEYQFLRHDGVYRWFLCRAQPVCNSNGEVVKWFGTCTDIHRHKRIEQILRRSNDDLKQLTAAAAQDLQEHLRKVTLQCQLARQYRGQVAAEPDNYLETILEAATPMNLVLQDLLSYSLVNGEQQHRTVAAG